MRDRLKHGIPTHGRPKHGMVGPNMVDTKWQMKDKKKMVDGDVCVNAMAFSLPQQ